MEIIEQRKNPLLKREEIVFLVETEKTPSKEEMKKMISEKFKSQEDSIVIDRISGNFGTHTFKIESKIYDKNSDKDKFEFITRRERKKRAEEAKKVEEDKKAASANADGGQ